MPLFTKSEKQGLWPLATKGPDEENCIDIFAIHGLGGDKFRTWTDNGRLWLRDFLPEQLPEARIFTYGYDSTVAFSKSSAEVDDFARDFLHRVNSVRSSAAERTRPIVFICHSLGGLLFKQALVICNNDPKYRYLLEKFHGVVFMGTPHGGSDIAFWASYAGNLISAISFGTRSNKDLLGVLRKDSAFLGSLSQKFVLQSRFMHILSFYETEKFPMLNCRIVEKESAHLNVSNEIFLPITADHRTMCHFSNPASQKWMSFSSAIVKLARASAEAATILEPPLIRYREELNKWLDPLPMVDDYNRIRDLRLENTCEWINKEPKFLSWRNNSRRNVDLWVRGPPGCGKSTLAASIIDQLSMDRPIAYFFCNVEDPDRSDFTRVLRTLTWQLVLKKPHLADGIYDIYLESAGATTPIDSYKRALANLLKDGEPCYVVIDGLDECRGKYTDISKAIFHISSYAKLLIISRWDTWIQQCFPLGQMTSTFDIATTHTSEDLKRFVDNKSQELDLDPGLTAELMILLIAKAGGMFLWVKLTIEYLSQQATLKDTIEALKNLPEGLEPLYERLVRRLQMLPKSRYKLACKLMQWTFSSIRPLSVEQLKVALSVNPGDYRQKHPSNVLNLEKFVRDFGGPLLELNEAKGIVRFVHSSAVDFFSRTTAFKELILGDDFVFVPRVANTYCASVCLTYLSATDIDFVPDDKDFRVYKKNLDNHLDQYPFLRYCASNWWKHLPLSQNESEKNKKELGNAIRLFTSSQNCLVRWMQLFQILGGFYEENCPQAALFRSPESPYAWTFADRNSLFPHFWQAPSGLFTRWQRWKTECFFNGRYSTPIGIAAFFDFIDVVRSECERGRDIDEPVRLGLTPALLAAHGEAPNVLQYAVENGADLGLTSEIGYGIARYAARNSPSILRKVLDLGVFVGAPTLDDGTTPIHAACTTAGFHPSILPELLKHSSNYDLDATDFSGRTALHLAASINIKPYSRLVSDRATLIAGALPQHHRLHGGSPEEAFMPSNRAEVEAWLLSWNNYFATESNGANSDFDSDSPDDDMSKFHEQTIAEIVRNIKARTIIWLVERGASIVKTDSEGRTALDIVLSTGFAEDLDDVEERYLKRLSQAMASLGAMDANPRGPAALEVAMMRGHWVTVKAILKGDAATSKLSSNDRQFLSTTMNQRNEIQKDSTSGSLREYQPRSPGVALHASFILRFCLKKYSRSLRYDESIYIKLSTLIVDLAEYWVKTSDSITTSGELSRGNSHFQPSGKTIEITLPIAEGELRKVSFHILSSNYGQSGPHYSPSHSRMPRVFKSSYDPEMYQGTWSSKGKAPKDSPRDIWAAPILEMIRRPADSTGGSLLSQVKQGLGFRQDETIMVPSHAFQLCDFGPFENKSWTQTCYLPVNMRGSPSVEPEGVTKFLLSTSPHDKILLRPTEDFFAHDVALYGGFGIDIYSAWI